MLATGLKDTLVLLFRSLLGCVLLAVVGCTATPPAGDADALAEYKESNDPLEPTNRVFYAINDGIDTYLLRPAAVVYHQVPGVVRRPIHNMLANLGAPTTFANEVLQAHPRKAGNAMMRFVINSTAGVGGLFDVATDLGYPDHDTDFGLTLAVWGLDQGPFLFLPVLGPTNPRDTAGFAGQFGLDPLTYATFPGSKTLGYTRYGMTAVDTRERLLDPIDQMKRNALDPYATFRSLYRQHRSEEESQSKDSAATVPAWFRK
jgi:phospholipid-binding lipoprotein MlaA